MQWKAPSPPEKPPWNLRPPGKKETYRSKPAVLGVQDVNFQGGVPSGKRSHSDCWNDIPIFNRKIIFIHGLFSITMFIYQNV